MMLEWWGGLGLRAETASGFALQGVFTREGLAKRWKKNIKVLRLLLSGWRPRADVWRHVPTALRSKGVCTCLCACARLAGLLPDEIMDLSDKIFGNGGKKTEVTTSHPAVTLSWGAAAIREGGAKKFM